MGMMRVDRAVDQVTALARCEDALERARDPEVRNALIAPTDARAQREAQRSDERRRRVRPRSELDGLPITFKDVFDIAGTVTTAGSRARSAHPPADRDSFIVRRAHHCGLVTVGKTNMSELAFSGLGINRTFGTPANPNDAALVPGGSSSGAAVAVAAGIVPLAVGTDTSGSVRVPAAFCGCVGFRASRYRYGPHDFAPLSPTLDSIGLLAATIDDIVALDRLLAVRRTSAPAQSGVLRAVVPAGEWIDDCTPGVRQAFDRAMAALHERIKIDVVRLTTLDRAQRLMDRSGTIVGAEAYERYGRLLTSSAALEPATRRRLAANVGTRRTVGTVRAAMLPLRRQLRLELAGAVLLCPTVRHEPPRIDDLLASSERYDASNASTLRTTMALSYLGMCGVSLPLRGPDGTSTVGLLVSLPENEDARLLDAASVISRVLEAAD
ncbi:amidase family protein [Mycolicibacterium phlei]